MSVARVALACLALSVALASCGGGSSQPVAHGVAKPGPYAGTPVRKGALTLPGRVQGKALALAKDGRFQPRFWAGVDLGVTTPGHSPGELSPTRADYDRWLDGMARLGARLVRVYTILPPSFYDALAAHNKANPGAPLYFMQGVWIPEEQFLATGNAYDPAVTKGFDAEIADAVDVVHGAATIPAKPGHASGTYRSDVSRWLLAWSPGIEWDPVATASTNRKNPGVKPYHGRYITASANANPMESWIAARLDHLATLEHARGWSRPVTFTNWLTADPLEHPYEPLSTEDMVSIDAMHLHATHAWPGGFFASYHAYPYYPDSLRWTPRYRRASDPYAAYLHDLRAHHHGQAVMITEFGVPTGLGSAHLGPKGRGQGNHSEQQAAAMDAAMMHDIRAGGFAGGVLFEWTDEWFKRTWNTQDTSLPVDRRPLWHNMLTNEAQFGVVAVDPGKRQSITVDGKTGDWNGIRPLANGLRVTSDAAYVYVLLERPDANATTPIGFDVRPGNGDEARLTVGPGRTAHLEIAAFTDPISFLYGAAHDYVPVDPAALKPGSGAFVEPRLILNRPYTIPASGEKRPVELMDIGHFRWGTADPSAAGYDGRVLAAGDGRTVELRIPWMMLGYADPSSHQVYDLHDDGTVTTRGVGPLTLSVGGRSGAYDWKHWNAVAWHERTKAGWGTLVKAYAAASR